MMKSVFLSDSRVLDNDISETDNDYIIVHSNTMCSNDDLYQLDEELEDQDDDFMIDEEEYDYCDDAMTEGVQPQQGCFCLSPSLITEEMILEQTERPSIQRILDEAHASASQLKSFQLHQLVDLSSCNQSLYGDDDDDDDHKQEEHEALAYEPESVPGRLESSASDNSVLSRYDQNDQKHDNEQLDHGKVNQGLKESNAFITTGTTSEEEVEMEDIDGEDTPTCASKKLHLGGRMSNKKRRKKMKLLKKAAAAAKATSALSTTEGPPNNTKSSSKVTGKNPSPAHLPGKRMTNTAPSSTKVRPASRCYSKRVANVAVACATETLASYKAEIGLQTGKGAAASVKKGH